MQHNFISQGKNYISSKRASEISDYASDYIGQLCRAQKLDCQRVGHVWFLTEESLRSHMTNVWSADSLRVRANNLQRRFIKEKVQQPGSHIDEKKRITSKQAALMSGYAPDYIGQLCRGGKLDAVMIGKTWMVAEESLKDHLEKLKTEEQEKADAKKKEQDDKLFESRFLGRSITSLKEKPVEKVLAKTNAASAAPSVKSNQVLSLQTPSLLMKSVVSFSAVAVIVVVASMALVRFGGTQNPALRQPLVASVYETANSISDLVTGRGLAVAPRTGVINTDTAMQAAIQDSFSDQVNVAPDKSGTAGVITPVFKKTNGKDFLYVMVPVKDASGKVTSATSTVSSVSGDSSSDQSSNQ